MRAVVDTHIRVHADDLSPAAFRDLVSNLTVANPDFKNAKKEQAWGWRDMDTHVALYEVEADGTLLLPRGYAHFLNTLGEVDWDDQRAHVDIDTSLWPEINAKGPHQARAMEIIAAVEQGVVQMPPGSGKTVAVLDAIRRAGQRAIVLVDKSNIAAQWADRCNQFLGFRPGVIGDGEWAENPFLNVAMVQTLWSRRDSLPASWWRNFGFVCLDECHHSSARTYSDILQRFPAAWRIGVSATPHMSDDMRPFVESVLGPTILEAPSDQRVDPVVCVVPTEYRYLFWPTHQIKPSGNCGFKYCTRVGKVHRNNYNEMMTDLCKDRMRNHAIASRAAKSFYEGRAVLVLSKRKDHLKRIREFMNTGIGSTDLLMLTGNESKEQRMQVYSRAAHGKCVVFSTIANEALDIPRLDSVHMAYPTRNVKIVEQQVGRVVRPHPDKLQPEVVEYRDLTPILLSQLRGRTDYYSAEGWTIREED